MIKHLRDRRLLAVLVICILAAPQLVQGAINVARAIGPGAKMDASASVPANCGASSTSGCLWLKSGDGFHGSYNGTDTLFGAGGGGGGGGSLQSAYTAGGAGGGIVGLTSSGGGLVSRDNATPLTAGTPLLGAQNSSGSAHYFECSSTGCAIGAAAPGSIALNVPAGLNIHGTTSTNSPMLTVSDNNAANGTQAFFEDRSAGANLKRFSFDVLAGEWFFSRVNDNGLTGDTLMSVDASDTTVIYKSGTVAAVTVDGPTGQATFSQPLNVQQIEGGAPASGFAGFFLSPGELDAYANLGTGTPLVYMTGGNMAPYTDDTTSAGNSSHKWSEIDSYRFLGNSNTISFSATPSINCTAGETILVGPVTGNITGATMTGGGTGEPCTVIFLHDGTTTAFTIAWSGTNVRSASTTMAGVAGSLTNYEFKWNDRLSTPAWVQRGAANNVN